MEQGFYSMKDVQRLTTLSDTSIWRLIDAGEFPRPHRLTTKRAVWPIEMVDAWLRQKKAAMFAAAEQTGNTAHAAA